MNIAPPGYGHLGSMGDKEGAILMETMYILAAKTSNKRPYSGAPPAPPPHPALQAPLNLLPILPTIAAEHMQQLCNQASIPALTYSPSSHRPQQGLHVPPSALGSSLYQHVAQPPQQLHTRPSPPRVRLVPYSNQRPEQPVAGSTNISLILEVGGEAGRPSCVQMRACFRLLLMAGLLAVTLCFAFSSIDSLEQGWFKRLCVNAMPSKSNTVLPSYSWGGRPISVQCVPQVWPDPPPLVLPAGGAPELQ
eukprot:scaffold24672_cov23-Tisochrysis_lutea.AAC.1